MYSWEIQQLLELRNYLLYVDEYFKICSESPQINWIKYDNYSQNFTITTDDRYKFEFKVRKRELK